MSIGRWTLILLGLAVLTVTSCGGSDEDAETCVSEITGVEVPCNRDIAVSEAEYAEQKEEREAEQAEAEAEAEQVASECDRQLGDFLRVIEDLDSRLSVGLPYQDYNTRLGDIRSAYDRINFRALDVQCGTSVGIPAENALQQYAKAGDTWGDCIADFGCDTDSIDPELQRRWLSASRLLGQADRGLDGLGEPPGE